MEKYAKVSWTANDVMDAAEIMGMNLTEEKAVEFLLNNSKQIQEDMIKRGWDSISTLLELENYIVK